MKFFFPFRYKLTAIIALIIVALLYAIYSVVQQDIERQFRVLIDERLIQAKSYVSQRMDDRYLLLRNDATAAVNDKLVLDTLIDKNLSLKTRNDIISNEVLPKFSHLDLLAVTDADGMLKAQQQDESDVVQSLLESEWFEYALEGDSVAGYVLHQNEFYQGIAMPVFLGPAMIGIVVAGRELSLEDITQIKQTSEIDIAVLNHNTSVIATRFSGLTDSAKLQQAFENWVLDSDEQMLKPGETLEVKLGSERFMLRMVIDETLFVPPYIIARSLDESLEFVTSIRENMEALGGFSILLASAVGFLFAVGISSPIKRLALATSEVASENFDHRVDIQSKDEFSQLGDSFNQMIVELKEKQKIRSAFDKSVSKQVADHMLAQDAQLGGHTDYATILFADIRGFTTLSEELDETSLINLLNEYFSRVNGCITDEKGVIDKFIGDALMALFGTPIPCENAAYHGLMASRNMLQTVEKFNEQARLIYGCELNIGIGLNSGKVVAGMVGSNDRLNFTVLGDQVNIASRIEGLCKNYGVTLILSESTVEEIRKDKSIWQEPIVFRRLDRVQVKGKTRGLDIYQPIFTDDDELIRRISGYEQALKLVLEGRVQKALDEIVLLSQQWPEDIPSNNLREACLRYLGDKQAYARDYHQGVRVLLSK